MVELTSYVIINVTISYYYWTKKEPRVEGILRRFFGSKIPFLYVYCGLK